jgi:hypothetical protein
VARVKKAVPIPVGEKIVTVKKKYFNENKSIEKQRSHAAQ